MKGAFEEMLVMVRNFHSSVQVHKLIAEFTGALESSTRSAYDLRSHVRSMK